MFFFFFFPLFGCKSPIDRCAYVTMQKKNRLHDPEESWSEGAGKGSTVEQFPTQQVTTVEVKKKKVGNKMNKKKKKKKTHILTTSVTKYTLFFWREGGVSLTIL